MLILSLKKELHIKRDTICQDDVKKRLTSAEHNIIFKTKCSGTKETSPVLQKYAWAVLPTAAFCPQIPLRAMHTGYTKNKAAQDYFEEGLQIY